MSKLLTAITLLFFSVATSGQSKTLTHIDPKASTSEETSSSYNRDDYLPFWADADRNCINTRHEVLILESQIPVTMSESGCYVLKGEWLDLATDRVFTDPSDVDIDHTVALSEAHRSGAWRWGAEKKKFFANDLLNTAVLEVMDDNTNALKGDKDPSEWLPPNKEYHVTYVQNWVEIKTLYGLTFDKKEIAVIEEILGSDIEL